MSWRPEFEDFKHVSKENAQLVFSEAEKSLAATISDAESLSRNAVYLIGVTIAILSACAGFIVKSLSVQNAHLSRSDLQILIVSALFFVYIGVVAVRLLHGAFRSKEIEHPGNTPENLIRAEYMKLDNPALLLLEASSYRDRILKNAHRNAVTGHAINTAIRWLCFAPLAFVAAFGISALALTCLR